MGERKREKEWYCENVIYWRSACECITRGIRFIIIAVRYFCEKRRRIIFLFQKRRDGGYTNINHDTYSLFMYRVVIVPRNFISIVGYLSSSLLSRRWMQAFFVFHVYNCYPFSECTQYFCIWRSSILEWSLHID